MAWGGGVVRNLLFSGFVQVLNLSRLTRRDFVLVVCLALQYRMHHH